MKGSRILSFGLLLAMPWLSATSASAEVLPELRDFLIAELAKASTAPAEKVINPAGEPTSPGNGHFALSFMMITVQAKGGFTIDGIANLSLVPSVTFMWY